MPTPLLSVVSRIDAKIAYDSYHSKCAKIQFPPEKLLWGGGRAQLSLSRFHLSGEGNPSLLTFLPRGLRLLDSIYCPTHFRAVWQH